jgi:2-methylcitrate dehydratase PrpD
VPSEAVDRAPASAADRLARYAYRFELSDAPADVVAAAKLCILDALGIALASTRFDFADVSVAAIRDLAGEGEHVAIGMRGRFPLRDAALLNGILIHGLDYDDTHPESVIHASASAVPVVLAEGRRQRASGARALAAYLLAVEADARLGLRAGGWWQKAGFHPTAVVGVFGAALAAGYLRSQPVEALAQGQGIALSMASGSMEFLEDGSWTKRLHPGWAASSGISAASLASHGFVAPRRAFEGRFGLYNAYLGGRSPPVEGDLFAGLGERWEMRNVAIKPYPVCHFNHACGDAVLALRAEHGFEAEDVESIVARIHRNQMPVVCDPIEAKRRPQSDYDAKFSLPFFVATCVVRGRFGLGELDRGTLTDPRILALCDRIVCEHSDASAFPRYFSGEVEVLLRDGRRLVRQERVNRGADVRPLAREDVEAKFFDNATRAVPRAQAEAVREAVLTLDRAPGLDALCEALAAR